MTHLVRTSETAVNTIIELADILYESLEEQFRDETSVIDYDSQMVYVGYDKLDDKYIAAFDCFITVEIDYDYDYDYDYDEDEEYCSTHGFVEFEIIDNNIEIICNVTGHYGIFYPDNFNNLKKSNKNLIDLILD